MSNGHLRRALADLHKGRDEAPPIETPAVEPAEEAEQSAEQSDTHQPSDEEF
ncbi:hypothetical protein JCM18899A_18790 [Nocardioides sp. AN3]